MALIRNAANKVRRGVVGQDTFYYTGGRQIVRQAKNNSNYDANPPHAPSLSRPAE